MAYIDYVPFGVRAVKRWSAAANQVITGQNNKQINRFAVLPAKATFRPTALYAVIKPSLHKQRRAEGAVWYFFGQEKKG